MLPNCVRFLWDYTPVYRPFSPIANTSAFWGQGALIGKGRTLAHQAYTFQEAPTALASDYQGMFGADFYNRIHYSAVVFALGNLVGNQVRELRVWNGYRRARRLEALDLQNGEGILISGQPAPPLQFAPQQERVYTLEITTDGPPSVDAALVFDFDEGQTGTVLITGSRVTPWPWEPDWNAGVGEVLEWLTEITESENGSEQATAMRLTPRRSIDFGVGAEGRARRAMETAAAGWGGRVWAVPIWPDAQAMESAVTVGMTTIPCKTAGRDLYIGGLAMFIGATYRDYEVVEILDVTPTTLVLKRPTVRAWPIGTQLYPARTARIDGGATFNRFTGDAHTGRITFDVVGASDWPKLTDLPTYRGYPVLEDQPEWSQEPTMLYARKLGVRDNYVGRPDYTDRGDVTVMRQSHRWSAVGRAQLARIRSLLYTLRGKHAAIWVPSWVDDFELHAEIPSTSSAADIKWMGYTLYVNGARGRRDVRIAVPGAAPIYRRIANSVELNADVERLGLDSPVPSTIPVTATVQYLTLWRLDTDRLEFAWWCGDSGNDHATADIPMPMRSFRNDV